MKQLQELPRQHNGTIHTKSIPHPHAKISACRKCGHVRIIDRRYGVCGVKSCYKTNKPILEIQPVTDSKAHVRERAGNRRALASMSD